MQPIEKPGPGEHVPYVLQYFNLIPDDGRILEHLREDLAETSAFLRSLPPERLCHRHAPGKWTIKEIIQHVSDDERIYAYRALRFARGDRTELPGFDPDAYTPETRANLRSLEELLDEFAAVRAGTLTLFAGLGDEALLRSGVAAGNIMSVRAIAYHIAGHERWHMKVIRERYLAS